MAFQKGHKLSGSRKDKPNKATQSTREVFQLILDANAEQLMQDISEMEPRLRAKFLIDMAGFCVPRLTAVDLQAIVEASVDKTVKHHWTIEDAGSPTQTT
jgi:hypothetical protein